MHPSYDHGKVMSLTYSSEDTQLQENRDGKIERRIKGEKMTSVCINCCFESLRDIAL